MKEQAGFSGTLSEALPSIQPLSPMLPEPYYQEKGIVIYHGDCREILPYLAPVDLVLTPDERYLLSANQTAHSVSLVRIADGTVLTEAPCGERPAALALTPDGKRLVWVSDRNAKEPGEFNIFLADWVP